MVDFTIDPEMTQLTLMDFAIGIDLEMTQLPLVIFSIDLRLSKIPNYNLPRIDYCINFFVIDKIDFDLEVNQLPLIDFNIDMT